MMIDDDALFERLEILIDEIEQEIDDRMWADPDDPKVPRLQQELKELKKELSDGVRYRPNF